MAFTTVISRPSLAQVLLGSRYSREYLCVRPFVGANAYMDAAGVLVDVTHRHHFLGYMPTLVALPCRAERVLLTISDGPITGDAHWRGHVTESAASGRVLLDRRQELTWGALYEGVDGDERTLGMRGIFAHRVLERRDTPTVGGTRIDPGSSSRMRVLYSLARNVDWVTVPVAGGFNRFPVDLHGITGDQALFSLRAGARSAAQIEQAGTLLFAAMPAEMAEAVYATGPNHMAEKANLTSELFAKAPVGIWRVADLKRIFALGEHQIFAGRVVEAQKPPAGAPRLAHIHRDAVVRRDRRGLSTPVVER